MSMKKHLQILCTLGLLLMTTQIFAQPENDNCADAISVMDGTTAFSNIDATEDGPSHPDDCPSGGDAPDTLFNDIWYTYTATIDGEIEWSMCNSVDFDTKIAVYAPGSSCPPASTDIIACNEDAAGCGVSSVAVFTVVSGETYLLRLGAYGPGAGEPGEEGSGTFTLGEYIPPVGPENDNCEDAIEVFVGFGQEFSTQDATTDGPDHPDNSCFGFNSLTADNDIWYTFTPDFTGFAEWSVCDMASFDTRMAVYYPNITCPVADEDLYACNDDGENCPNFSSKLFFEVTAGETYLLRLGGFNGDSGIGTFYLADFTPPEPPSNDECAAAIPTCVMSPLEADEFDYAILGTTLNATFDSDSYIFAPCLTNTNGGEFADVWYRFNSEDYADIEIRAYAQTSGAEFIIDVWASCENIIDTLVVADACLIVTEMEPNVVDTLETLMPNTEYLLHVSTRITSDMSGDFIVQLVGDENASGDCILNTSEPAVLDQLMVRPNPANDIAELSYGLKETSSVGLEIRNTIGECIFRQTKERLPAGSYSQSIDLSTYPQGIYFVTVYVDGVPQTKKVIKQ